MALLNVLLVLGLLLGGNRPALPQALIGLLAARPAPSSVGIDRAGRSLFMVDGPVPWTAYDRLRDGEVYLSHVRSSRTKVCASPYYLDYALAAGLNVKRLLVVMRNRSGRISVFTLTRQTGHWMVLTSAAWADAYTSALRTVGRGLVCEAQDLAWRRLADSGWFAYRLDWL